MYWGADTYGTHPTVFLLENIHVKAHMHRFYCLLAETWLMISGAGSNFYAGAGGTCPQIHLLPPYPPKIQTLDGKM